MLFYITAATIIAVALWYYLVKPLTYWSDQGVSQTKPWVLLGDSGPILFRRKCLAHFAQWIYNMYPDEKYVGWFNLGKPSLLLKDPEVIKQFCVKDFEHFTDHVPIIEPDADPLWSKTLFSLRGDRWKEMRNVVSPTFTSSKIKNIFVLMVETAESFIEYFNEKNEEVIEVDMREVLTRYTNDVIATTAFGVKVDSLKEPENTFYLMGKKITNVRGVANGLKFLLFHVLPALSKHLGLTFLNPVASKYFHEVIDDTIKVREEKKIVRPDIINILLEARKDQSNVNENGKPKRTLEITNDEITSQAVIFFFAGFDTVSTAMCFGSYELAMNKNIQDKLREEIRQVAKNEKVTYDNLQEMKYMDMVVSETLRKWPPFPTMDRICTKPYTYQPSDNKPPIHFKKDYEILLPIFPLHRDPKNFPNPETFNPERFSDENKHNIVPYTYMPFGVGPRICIGNRFALIEIKALFFNLLLNYEIVPTDKTPTLPVLKKDFQLDIEGGFNLGLKRIK